jgi:hypothetical protein
MLGATAFGKSAWQALSASGGRHAASQPNGGAVEGWSRTGNCQLRSGLGHMHDNWLLRARCRTPCRNHVLLIVLLRLPPLVLEDGLVGRDSAVVQCGLFHDLVARTPEITSFSIRWISESRPMGPRGRSIETNQRGAFPLMKCTPYMRPGNPPRPAPGQCGTFSIPRASLCSDTGTMVLKLIEMVLRRNAEPPLECLHRWRRYR